MSNLDVRLITLEPMRVAASSAYGPSPEGDAIGGLAAWIERSGALHEQAHPRYFGFDNPSPDPGSPNYGYEMWVTVGPEAQPGGSVTIKDFPGGKYAVARVVGVENIYAAWQQLVAWSETSPYHIGTAQCLEEHLNFGEENLAELALDLYLPVEE